MKYLALLIFASVSTLAIGQNTEERETDWRLRTGASVDYKFNKDWKTDLNWESRFKDNISSYDESILEYGISYDTPWDIDLQTSFRHYFVPDKPDGYRLNLGAGYDKFIDDSNFEIATRLRWQYDNNYAPEERDPEQQLRLKLSGVYELGSRLVFVLEDEIFYKMGDKDEFSKNRITAGIEFIVSDQLELNAFYRFENDINKSVNDFENTIGIYAAYRIKKKKENDKKSEPTHFGHPYRW